MRHPLEHAEHEVKYGCLMAWLVTLGGILFFFWPLAISATPVAGHVRWWTWLIEIPWLIIAITLVAVIARRRRGAGNRR